MESEALEQVTAAGNPQYLSLMQAFDNFVRCGENVSGGSGEHHRHFPALDHSADY